MKLILKHHRKISKVINKVNKNIMTNDNVYNIESILKAH